MVTGFRLRLADFRGMYGHEKSRVWQDCLCIYTSVLALWCEVHILNFKAIDL